MKKYLYFSIISFFISSATILAVPFTSFYGEAWENTLRFALGGLFWLGFIAGFLFLIPISKRRKAERKYKELRGFAFFRFFSNKPAVVFDVLLILSAVIVAAWFVIKAMPDLLGFAGLFGVVFGLEMHGVFNGKNYRYIQNKR